MQLLILYVLSLHLINVGTNSLIILYFTLFKFINNRTIIRFSIKEILEICDNTIINKCMLYEDVE